MTYRLGDAADDGMFDIDPRTGQLMVKTKLDYEAGPAQCASPNECSVTVSAADSSGVAGAWI